MTLQTKKLMLAIPIVVLVLLSFSAIEVKAEECTHFSGNCRWYCIPLFVDKVVDVNGSNAQVYQSGCEAELPDVLPTENDCGDLYPQHWYGCWTQSGGYGTECNYDCEEPF